MLLIPQSATCKVCENNHLHELVTLFFFKSLHKIPSLTPSLSMSLSTYPHPSSFIHFLPLCLSLCFILSLSLSFPLFHSLSLSLSLIHSLLSITLSLYPSLFLPLYRSIDLSFSFFLTLSISLSGWLTSHVSPQGYLRRSQDQLFLHTHPPLWPNVILKRTISNS